MKKRSFIAILCFAFLFLLNAEGENKKIHAFLMIDKSLSMEEEDNFSFLQNWLNNYFLPPLANKDNTVTVFFFYGDTNKVFSKTLKTNAELKEIQTIIQNENPDGAFSDIGLAKDVLMESIQNNASNAIPVGLIFSDLVQEAAWPSDYAGTYYDFAERYLMEDRVIALKNNCYQVTIQLEKAKTIEKRAEKIYTAIINSTEEPMYRQ